MRRSRRTRPGDRSVSPAANRLAGLRRPACSLGHSLKTVGRQKEATESYQTATAARPELWRCLLESRQSQNLSLLAGRDCTTCALHEADRRHTLVDRYHLCFALGKALEDRDEYARILAILRARQRTEAHARAVIDPDIHRNQHAPADRSVHGAASSPRACGVGARHPDPIFIVGLPRSGSTLIEQILASHSQVEGTQELPRSSASAGAAGARSRPRRSRYSEGSHAYARGACRIWRRVDFRGSASRPPPDTRPDRGAWPFFIDKMPNNFRHLGLIHLMLPNAKIIDVRREPMACCF